MKSNPFPMCKTRRWSWTLALHLFFCLPSMAQHIPKNAFADHVVWQDGSGSYAVFIPEAQLQYKTLKRLPYHQEQISQFEQLTLAKYDDIETRELDKNDCMVMTHRKSSFRSRQEGRALVDVLRDRGIAAYGHVVDIQTGWGIQGVKTMIYLRTEEILHCKAGPRARKVSVGDVVSVSLAKGEISVDGVWLCNRTDDSLGIPAIGDRVVVAGFPFVNDAYYLAGGMILPLGGDRFLPQPYGHLLEESDSSYESLRGYFNPVAIHCGEVLR